MITRILPRDEWHKLDGTEIAPLWPHLNEENTRMVVVEDDGEVVGCWAMLRVVHAECLWIAPKYRGKIGVATRLIRGMRKIAVEWGVTRVITGSVDPHVTDLIKRFGGVPMPCESFILPAEPSDSDLGRAFHAQLKVLVPEDQHPEDEKHNERVGNALRVAIAAKDPDRAMAEYNEWAESAGYERVRYIGVVDGKLRADIATAIIDVDDNYNVSVVRGEACQS